MATFRFRFETVLQHRRTSEDACQRDLAKELRQRMILQDQLRQMQQTILASKRQLGDALIGRIEMPRIAQFARYSGQTTQRAHGLVARLATIEKRIDRERRRLVEATRARKAIEILRQRHYQRWLREQERRQTVELDDLALQAYSRRIALEVAR